VNQINSPTFCGLGGLGVVQKTEKHHHTHYYQESEHAPKKIDWNAEEHVSHHNNRHQHKHNII
jgi:hypothetical protein